jgi:hypothetical protein
MPRTLPPRQKANGLIGQGDINKLYDAGLTLVYAAELERLQQRVAELERANAVLREIAADSTRVNVVSAQVIGEVMGR